MSSGPSDEDPPPPQWDPPQWQQPQPDHQQWGQEQPQWSPQSQRPVPLTPGAATAALILGICSLVICPWVCGPLALAYGYRARTEIDVSAGRLTGRGIATAGVVTGWIGCGFALLITAVLTLVIAVNA